LDPHVLYDVLAINAASASTQLAGLPFSGPIGGVRVALIDGHWVAFPKWPDLQDAVFDMVVAGRVLPDGDVAIMMVEAEATEHTIELVKGGATAPTEEIVAQGLDAAKLFIKELCRAQVELAKVAAKETKEFPIFKDYQDDVYEAVSAFSLQAVSKAMQIGGKVERQTALDEAKAEVLTAITDKFPEREKEIKAAFSSVSKKVMRERVLRDKIRIDGRTPVQLRDLSAEINILPRTHGSALFNRGETQVLGVTTLNMLELEQKLDTLSPETTKRYMHNYNMPPYSTGEIGRVGTPKRREIGHGALAERALVPVLPGRTEFPYAIRQVSEAISSNGSTSMASVCASTMAMLNAGVPLKAMVGGIAMGLISGEVDGKREYVALTDILGAEDALGDMDFKVAGTSEFITALQLDTKLDGIPANVLAAALKQAKDARTTILNVMQKAIDAPGQMSQFTPRIISVKVPIDMIGSIIGPKGKMINEIQEKTGAKISIEDDGTVFIGATDGVAADKAKAMIDGIANPHVPTVGEKYEGKVVKTAAFGAFVNLYPGKDGLLHISQLKKMAGGKRVEKVEDVINVGDTVHVEINEIDTKGKLSLVPVVEGEDSAKSE
ncbi:MAG: polyribonucleotide nucleotidyltransferase, partial [Actinobacteria bacterium]|nr:polyribonucleotide nucleotidyltransferase [Actinomycetota bacterium]